MPNTVKRTPIPYGTPVAIRKTKERATVLGRTMGGRYRVKVWGSGEHRWYEAAELNQRPSYRKGNK